MAEDIHCILNGDEHMRPDIFHQGTDQNDLQKCK